MDRSSGNYDMTKQTSYSGQVSRVTNSFEVLITKVNMYLHSIVSNVKNNRSDSLFCGLA